MLCDLLVLYISGVCLSVFHCTALNELECNINYVYERRFVNNTFSNTNTREFFVS